MAGSTSALPPLIRLLHRVSASALLLAASTVPAAGQAADPNDAIRLPPPSYPQAVAEMRAGRPTTALDALDRAARSSGAETPPLEHAILRAALLARAGRPEEAENAWREVIDGAVFMRTFARRALVDSLAGRGAPADAEPILDALASADAARHRDLLLRVAAAHLDAGAPERAAALYRRVLGVSGRGADADAARLGLAGALEAAGDGSGALDALREAQLRHRTADAFVAARRDSARLAAARGVDIRPFNQDQYRTLVRRLRSASRYAPALDLLDEWAAAHPAAAASDRRALERVTTLYDQRDNAAAAAACRAFAEQHPASPLLPNVRLTDFRLAVRVGDKPRARRLGLDLWEGRVAGATTSQRRAAALLLGAYLVAVGGVDGGTGAVPRAVRDGHPAGRPALAPVARRRGRAQGWTERARARQPARSGRPATGRRPGAGGAVLAGGGHRARRRSIGGRPPLRVAGGNLSVSLLRPDRAAAAGGARRRGSSADPAADRFSQPRRQCGGARPGGVQGGHGARPGGARGGRRVVSAPPARPAPGRPGAGAAGRPRLGRGGRPCRGGARGRQSLRRFPQPARARHARRLLDAGLSPAVLGDGRAVRRRARGRPDAAGVADAAGVTVRPGRRGPPSAPWGCCRSCRTRPRRSPSARASGES